MMQVKIPMLNYKNQMFILEYNQAISFSIAESLKKDVVPIRKYYIMVKLFEKLPKLVEKKKPIGNTF